MTVTRSTVQGRLDELLICCGVLDGEAGRGKENGRKEKEEGRGGGRERGRKGEGEEGRNGEKRRGRIVEDDINLQLIPYVH